MVGLSITISGDPMTREELSRLHAAVSDIVLQGQWRDEPPKRKTALGEPAEITVLHMPKAPAMKVQVDEKEPLPTTKRVSAKAKKVRERLRNSAKRRKRSKAIQ